MAEPDDLVPVFATADVALLMVVKSVLDAEGIDYLVQGEESLGLFPVGPIGGGLAGRAFAAIVKVAPEKAAEVEALLKEVAPPDPAE